MDESIAVTQPLRLLSLLRALLQLLLQKKSLGC